LRALRGTARALNIPTKWDLLKHLQRFLTGGSYSDNNNYHHHYNYNVETILLPLQNGTVNVYELIDTFVSYLVTTSSSSPYSV
jgi:hypothetical protein